MNTNENNGRHAPVLFFVLIVGLLFLQPSASRGIASAATVRSPCRVRHGSDDSIPWVSRPLNKGETPEAVFGDRWRDVLRFNRIDRRHAVPGICLKVPERLDDIRDFTPLPRNYPPAEADADAKLILVDLSEQFLGAYEHGQLVFSAPITTGFRSDVTPTGRFRVTAYQRHHRSSMYRVEHSTEYYPMTYGLRFYINRYGISYWIHGRDLPGYPASHGCIGLYDEEMQKEVYHVPAQPELDDARKLFEWVVPALPVDEGLHELEDGPRVVVVGAAPGTRPPAQPKEAPPPTTLEPANRTETRGLRGPGASSVYQ